MCSNLLFLIAQLVLVWQLLGGGKEALLNIDKMRDSVPAQEFFDILRSRGYY